MIYSITIKSEGNTEFYEFRGLSGYIQREKLMEDLKSLDKNVMFFLSEKSLLTM